VGMNGIVEHGWIKWAVLPKLVTKESLPLQGNVYIYW